MRQEHAVLGVEVRHQPLVAERSADRATAFVAQVAVREELAQDGLAGGMFVVGFEDGRRAEVAHLAGDQALDQIDAERLVEVEVRLDAREPLDRLGSDLGVDHRLQVARERALVATFGLVVATEIEVDATVLGQSEGGRQQVAQRRLGVTAIHVDAPHAAVHLVDRVRIAVLATALDAVRAGDQDLAPTLFVLKILHQVEHHRGLQVGPCRLPDPGDGALGVLVAGHLVEALFEQQLGGFVRQAHVRVGVEPGLGRVRVLFEARDEEGQVLFGEVRRNSGQPGRAHRPRVHAHAEVFEQVDADHAERRIVADERELLGPAGDVLGEVDRAHAHRTDVAGGRAALLHEDAVDQRVVARAADRQRDGIAAVEPHGAPQQSGFQRERCVDDAIGLFAQRLGRQGTAGAERRDLDEAGGQVERHRVLHQHLGADRSDDRVLAELDREVLGEPLHVLLVTDLARLHREVEVVEVHRDRVRRAVGRDALQTVGGLVVQLQCERPFVLDEQVRGDAPEARRQVARHDEAVVDQLDRDAPLGVLLEADTNGARFEDGGGRRLVRGRERAEDQKGCGGDDAVHAGVSVRGRLRG